MAKRNNSRSISLLAITAGLFTNLGLVACGEVPNKAQEADAGIECIYDSDCGDVASGLWCISNECRMRGPSGQDGHDGLACWDLNGDGKRDSNEDINGDESVDVLDCRGVDGINGTDGVNGVDGVDGENGSNGKPGADGQDGQSCWDLNGNGKADTSEDTNHDGKTDVLDCRGSQGPAGHDGQDGRHPDAGTPNQEPDAGIPGRTPDAQPEQEPDAVRPNVCDPDSDQAPENPEFCDLDGDGVNGGSGGDCNEHNAQVKPGADELCDGIDNDCDGQIDEGCEPSPAADIVTIHFQLPRTNGVQLATDLVTLYGCMGSDVDWDNLDGPNGRLLCNTSWRQFYIQESDALDIVEVTAEVEVEHHQGFEFNFDSEYLNGQRWACGFHRAINGTISATGPEGDIDVYQVANRSDEVDIWAGCNFWIWRP